MKKYEVKECIGVIGKPRGLTRSRREVRLIDWGNGDKIDIRSWDDNERYSRGITLSLEEAATLTAVLRNYFMKGVRE